MKKLLVCFNHAAGGSKQQREPVEAAFADYKVEVQFCTLASFKKEVKKQQYNAIIAVGGDGTVNAVAAEALKYDVPLGIIPLGTLNHFAKDVGIPLDITDAVATICSGSKTTVDIGKVNNYIFLNNSSIGIYPALVKEREKHQSRLGKWPAMIVALVRSAAKIKRYKVRLEYGGQTLHCKTPFIFIGNNSYRLHKVGFTNRTTLQAGALSLYWITTSRRWQILRIFFRALRGKPHQDRFFKSAAAKKITITMSKSMVNVACDGEVHQLQTPLQYESVPKALEVLVPAR